MADSFGSEAIQGRHSWQAGDHGPQDLGKPAPKPLPGRANIIVSRSLAAAPGAQVVTSIEAALDAGAAAAAECGAGEVCLIGGAQLYADMLDQVDLIHLTEVDLEPEGDAVFPPLDPAVWREIGAETVAAGAGDDAGFTVRLLERRCEPG